MELACPYCLRRNENHLEPSEPLEVPQPGAASMCFGCGRVSIFDSSPFRAGLVLRRPTAIEAAELEGDEGVQVMLAAWRDKVLGKRMDPFDFADEVRARKGDV